MKPLIEEGGRILQEANGVIRGLDPDGRISANAKHKTAARDATPEEYRLADLLKEVSFKPALAFHDFANIRFMLTIGIS